MKIFLLTDLEGIPGVTTIEQMERDSLPNLRARELLGEWINKTAAYCREFGAILSIIWMATEEEKTSPRSKLILP